MNAIGLFDSGYGGLTVMKEVVRVLPMYDFIYLGDNARTPYGTRSFETVHRYTLEAVRWLFAQGCPLVILACNTASAKALRSIQQQDLPNLAPDRRVLGVIRPVVETIGHYTQSQHVGLFGTFGTVKSDSYAIETRKFFPNLKLVQEACPLWVPLIENHEFETPGADYFIQRHTQALLTRDPQIDAVILGCTHYPLIEHRIRAFLPPHIRLVNQGAIVAHSLADYLNRHPEMDKRLTQHSTRQFYTSDSATTFEALASQFYGQPLHALHVNYA